MKGTIVDLEWEHEDRDATKHKGNPTNIIIYTELENGDIISDNITGLVKNIKSWKRITENRVLLLKNDLVGLLVDVEFAGIKGKTYHNLSEAIEEV